MSDDEDGVGDSAKEDLDDGGRSEFDEADEDISKEPYDPDAICEECGDESEQPRMARDPGQPTPSQRAAHELTHCPFRAWCEHCVRGQSTGSQHWSVPATLSVSTVPRVHMEVAFLNSDV